MSDDNDDDKSKNDENKTIKQEFNGPVDQVAGRDIRNFYLPPDTHDFFCSHCGTGLKDGLTVCKGCKGEIVYGASAQEKNDIRGMNIMFVLLVATSIFILLPHYLNKDFGFNIPYGWWLPFWITAPIVLIFAFISAETRVEKENAKWKNRPPRIFRKSEKCVN